MNKLITLSISIFLSHFSYSQTWLQQAHRESDMTRIGFGIQAMEPTALLFQLYKGDFCSNDNTYANYFTLEAMAGFENTLLSSDKKYKEGEWRRGGFQGGVNVYYPLYTLSPQTFSAQVHIGAGIQGGNRKYEEQSQTKSDDILGGNLSLRFSLTGRGAEVRDGLWFVSYFFDAKYHHQFGERFYYFKPSFGLIFRKAR